MRLSPLSQVRSAITGKNRFPVTIRQIQVTILNNSLCRRIIFQRTATTPLTSCLSPRVHSNAHPPPALRPIPTWTRLPQFQAPGLEARL